jgi:Uma2 family endonuclease
VPPLLAVEVLSPDDKAPQVLQKINDYLRFEVRLVWVLDPGARTVTVFRRDRGQRLLQQSDEITGEEVLPGFACRVADFFRLPGEKPAG